MLISCQKKHVLSYCFYLHITWQFILANDVTFCQYDNDHFSSRTKTVSVDIYLLPYLKVFVHELHSALSMFDSVPLQCSSLCEPLELVLIKFLN